MNKIDKELDDLQNDSLLKPRLYSFDEVREIVKTLKNKTIKETRKELIKEIEKEIKGSIQNRDYQRDNTKNKINTEFWNGCLFGEDLILNLIKKNK